MANIYDYLKELAKIDVEYTDPHSLKTYTLKSYIKRLDDDCILIDPPSCNGFVCNLQRGQHLKIYIKSNDGIFSAYSSVIGKELSSISGIVITYPTSAKFNQRREYVRVGLNLPVELFIVEDKNTMESKILNVTTFDISGTGFSYISNEPLTKYYSINAKLYLKDSIEKPIEALCDHVYSHKTNSLTDIRYKNAFMFADMSKADNDRLVKAIFQFQLEQRRKGFI